ncbi:hypothetical protein PSQ90_04095 [Devosia rhodophyticola]|uniref:Beta/gamma crystallin 'Greek key' domain-containing protein n=1 Tax=Devosia rhodophyticola TaxID=3026423 RepID=A0ABY7YZH2_9HYPH|nr:hypothetical protein [Devosia rhodophyticola]WDR06652.1 hypothetical protein PSQ90_04095 [Devosia rhodophyticola]
MTMKSWVPAVLALAVFSVPAMATPFCNDDRGGVSITFGVGGPRSSSEFDQNQLDLMQLRRMGVDASSVERWNGCLRAFVRSPSGGEIMEYYDPNTFRQVF